MRRFAALSTLGLFLLAAAVAPVVAGEGKCSHDAQTCLDYLAKHMQGRGWAGVDLDESETAMTVKAVHKGTPADKAGVKIGDVLVAVNGIRIAEENHDKMAALMAEMKPGKSFDYTVERNGKERTFAITLAEMPEGEIARMIGAHMLKGHTTVEVASK